MVDVKEVIYTTAERRIVHLDLKGAPPKLSYYSWLFPLLHKWGATGLLVEYEDMFPYSGQLKDIVAPNAYSLLELQQFLALAKENKLEVFPLVQTFGHFEFVLKHDKFRHLREVEEYPMTICPSHEDTFGLIREMIDQVIAQHPDIIAFHIGADEVFHIGLCARCQETIKLNLFQDEANTVVNAPAELYFAHIIRILKYLRDKYSHLRLIIWDDMLRTVDLTLLKDSGIGKLVEPMVWCYQRQINLSFELWARYSKIFPGLWAASAFKGATGPCAIATDIDFHVENHKEWLNIVNCSVKPVMSEFYGYAITGWQRYDHFAVLCELLPVGIPSLAVCLLTVTTGAFTPDVHQVASQDLGFTQLIPMNPFSSSVEGHACQHFGSSIYKDVHALLHLKFEYKLFIKNDRLKGWMSDWHVENNFTNPAHLSHFMPHGQQLLINLEELYKSLYTAMSEIFYPDTVEEWMAVNVQPMLTKLRKTVVTGMKQISIGGRTKNVSCL